MTVFRGTAGRGKVTVTTYDKKMENFDTMNISNLDTWVFNKVGIPSVFSYSRI